MQRIYADFSLWRDLSSYRSKQQCFVLREEGRANRTIRLIRDIREIRESASQL